ncbi:MAG: hypothetical protein E7258_02865 [Lachnospiraceae bacterium]|nr:hypothetical protein [Lachnospiraceae bacterium]
MLVSSNIYNHLSSDLVPKKRNTTHKSSELHEVYTNMARYNKKTPLYLLNFSQSKQSQIINIKEAAMTLKEVSDCFTNTDSDVYNKKVLHSDNTDSITGSFKNGDLSTLPEELSIQVKTLAKEQINTGNYLPQDDKALSAGSYTFTLSTINSSSHFNITVGKDDTNSDIQQRISQYINNRNLGINASVVSDGKNSAIMLSSKESGVPSTDDGLHFSLEAAGEPNIVDAFGLDKVTTPPSNSQFTINGEEHTSTSNQISINQIIELDFHKPTSNPVHISFIPDTNVSISQIDMFVDAYNNLVDLSEDSRHVNPGSRSLYRDISVIVDKHKEELESAGLSLSEDNKLIKNDEQLLKSIQSGKFNELFQDISSFKDDVSNAANRLSLDPIAYINKLIVTYPNTQQQSSSVYNKSLYSGLMYNNYA